MIYILGMMGIAVFSITGVIAAGRKNMDLFSIVLLGIVTALGGGTLRDIMIDNNPIFWIGDLTYLWVSIAAALVAFIFVRYLNHASRFLMFADAFGVSLFTVLAAEKTTGLGFSAPVAVLMGVTTGAAGGMLRDIMTGRMPLLLGKEFYATPMLLGAISYYIMESVNPGNEYNRLCAIAIIFSLRSAAIQWGLYYPKWLIYGKYLGNDSSGDGD